MVDHKTIALEFFKLIQAGQFKEGLRFFAPDCKTHNPYVAGSINDLMDAMIAANKDGVAKYPKAEFAVRHALVDGDLVAVHTELINNKSAPSEGGLRQIHLFRFQDGKIVEYWDISQFVMPNLPNTAAAFG